MNWKNKLRDLEKEKKWDDAIVFMEEIIKDNPKDMDAYIYMNYLMMNLLIEEDFDRDDKGKCNYYEQVAKKYFDESYAKFSDNAEYLFYTGLTTVICPWVLGIDTPDSEKMLERALELDSDNPVYQCRHNIILYYDDLSNPVVTPYAQLVLQENSPVKKILEKKGAIGEYVFELLFNRSKKILGKA